MKTSKNFNSVNRMNISDTLTTGKTEEHTGVCVGGHTFIWKWKGGNFLQELKRIRRGDLKINKHRKDSSSGKYSHTRHRA